MTDEEINNVAKIFEALTRAKDRNENIKIEYLNEEGKTTFYTIDLNSDIQMIHFQVSKFGNIQLLNNRIPIPFFQQNIKDIQSITTFRTTELTFSETENESENEEKDYSF